MIIVAGCGISPRHFCNPVFTTVIEFLCPNGHRIRCQAEHAGRGAKCPRCGVKFRVPDPNDASVTEAVGSDSNVSRPEFTDSDVGNKKSAAAGTAVQKEPQIEFLCPNGHRLFGPATLQGKPGQCPECGSRFRIPTYEDISAEEASAQNINLSSVSDRNKPSAGGISKPMPPPVPSVESSVESSSPTTISGHSSTEQAMATLVARLWEIRPKGASLELTLRDGQTVVPSRFLKKLSQQSQQGVFVVKESNGSVAVVAVAWDAVAKAGLRGLSELPRELAD